MESPMKELRDRVLIPLAVPLLALAVIVVVVLNFSRVLLALEGEMATIVAIVTASAVLFGCAWFSSRGEARSAGNVGVLAVAGMLLVFSGLTGMAKINEEKSEAAADKPPPLPPGPPAATIHAFDLGFTEKTATIPAGGAKIAYVNDGTLQHTLLFDNVGGFKLSVASRGDTGEGVVKLEPGTYTYYCDVPGHRPAGMEGTMTVTPGGAAGAAAPGGAGGGAGIEVEAGDLFLKPSELKAAPGPVQVTYKNSGQLQHTLVVEEDPKFEKLVADGGKTVSGTLQVGPGTYTLYCDVPGHRAAGMEAKLLVG
jgi:plastocyanin